MNILDSILKESAYEKTTLRGNQIRLYNDDCWCVVELNRSEAIFVPMISATSRRTFNEILFLLVNMRTL